MSSTERLYVVNQQTTSFRTAAIEMQSPSGSAVAIAAALEIDTTVDIAASSAITTGYGIRINTPNTFSANSIGTFYGIEIANLNSSGSTATAYPLYIAAQDATNDFAIFQAGNTNVNALLGQTGLGTQTMLGNEKLRVAGDAYFDGTGNVGINVFPTSSYYLWVQDDDETTDLTGIRSELDKDSSGDGKDFVAYDAVISHTGSGDSTSYRGFRATCTLNTTLGSVTEYYGVDVSATVTSGQITNSYGIRIGAMNGTGNSFGIYQSGTDDNYFGGHVGINDDTPSYELDVSGDVQITDSLGVGAAPSTTTAINTGININSGTTVYGVAMALDKNTSGSLTNYRGFFSDGDVAATGTVTSFSHYYASQITNAGVVTNAYGLYIESQDATVTNGYGIYQVGTADRNNFAGSVVVGSTAAPTNSSVGLEVNSSTKAFVVSRMTTAQRTSLTGTNGMMVYDITLNELAFLINGSWVRRPGGLTGTFNFNGSTSGEITSMTFQNGVLTAVTTVP